MRVLERTEVSGSFRMAACVARQGSSDVTAGGVTNAIRIVPDVCVHHLHVS
jgi:hypothetical protein